MRSPAHQRQSQADLNLSRYLPSTLDTFNKSSEAQWASQELGSSTASNFEAGQHSWQCLFTLGWANATGSSGPALRPSHMVPMNARPRMTSTPGLIPLQEESRHLLGPLHLLQPWSQESIHLAPSACLPGLPPRPAMP